MLVGAGEYGAAVPKVKTEGPKVKPEGPKVKPEGPKVANGIGLVEGVEV